MTPSDVKRQYHEAAAFLSQAEGLLGRLGDDMQAHMDDQSEEWFTFTRGERFQELFDLIDEHRMSVNSAIDFEAEIA